MRLLCCAVIALLLAGCGGTAESDTVFDEGDEQVIEQLRETGADLERPRPVDFYLYFDSRDDARAAEAALANEGRVVTEAPSPEIEQWTVLLTKRMVVSRETIGKLQARLTTVAEEHDGEYDGWEAPAEP